MKAKFKESLPFFRRWYLILIAMLDGGRQHALCEVSNEFTNHLLLFRFSEIHGLPGQPNKPTFLTRFIHLCLTFLSIHIPRH